MVTQSAEQLVEMSNPANTRVMGQAMPAADGVIEMRLREVHQLFDPVDPSPFGGQDLSQWAAEYIVESVQEMQVPMPSRIEISIEEPCDSDRTSVIGGAVRRFFARQAMLRQRSLRRLLRRGLTTLVIGVTFLAAFFGLSQVIALMLDEGPVSTLLREGSLIVGWVAMWRPIEIFLYDWWPILAERRMYITLSQTEVRISTPQPESSLFENGGQPVPAAGGVAAKAIERWENEGGRTGERGPGKSAAGTI